MNWHYVTIGVVRRQVPTAPLFKLMQLRGDGSIAETEPDRYYQEYWRSRFTQRGLDLTGKHVLDIGSGRYARLALRLLADGAARVTLIDFYATPLSEPEYQATLAADCSSLGLDLMNALSRITVLQDDFVRLPPPPLDQRADLAMSSAVLEHVRDPGALLARCFDWLRPGGVTYHMVDMRDHNLAFRYPCEMLTFSSDTWATWFDLRGGFHLNRWRLPDYRTALRAAGFLNCDHETLAEDHQNFQRVLPRLDPQFRRMPPNELAVLMAYFYGERP